MARRLLRWCWSARSCGSGSSGRRRVQQRRGGVRRPGRGIAGGPAPRRCFPVFRAHPLLFQSLLSVFYRSGGSDVAGRCSWPSLGVATVVVVYLLGRLLYGPQGRARGGAAAGGHALPRRGHPPGPARRADGLLRHVGAVLLARYCVDREPRGWSPLPRRHGAGRPDQGDGRRARRRASTAFFVLSHAVKVRASARSPGRSRHGVGRAAPFPLAMRARGRPRTAAELPGVAAVPAAQPLVRFYLDGFRPRSAWRSSASPSPAWSLRRTSTGGRGCCHVGRRPHRLLHAGPRQGLPVPAARGARGRRAGRPRPDARSACWAGCRGAVPAGRRRRCGRRAGRRAPQPVACPTWRSVAARPPAGAFLAGSGGLPGGREAGRWIDANLPQGATLLTIGPSMANIVAVLRPPAGVRPVGQPEPAAPQPVLRADRQRRTCELRTAASSTSSGTPSPRHARRLLRAAAALRRASTTASPSTPRRSPSTAPDGRPRPSRSSVSTRCGHEADSRPCARRRWPALVLPGAAPPRPPTSAGPATTTPIKHFVVLMQENHSFDNYFGTYPGADGIPAGVCHAGRPDAATTAGLRQAVPHRRHDPRRGPRATAPAIQTRQYDGGRMDGFVAALPPARAATARPAMGYYDGRDLPYYWNVADQYVLFDRFFSSRPVGSRENHLYWVAGTAPREPASRCRAARLRPAADDLRPAAGGGISLEVLRREPRPAHTFRPGRRPDRALAASSSGCRCSTIAAVRRRRPRSPAQSST